MEGQVPIEYPQEFEKSGHDKGPTRDVYAKVRKDQFALDIPPHRINTEHRKSLMGS